LPLVGALLASEPNGFRLIALPGGLALFVVPVLVHFVIPDSPRWLLRRGQTQAAIDTVNQFVRRCGNRVAPLTVADLGPNLHEARETLPPFGALFARGQFRWTAVGIATGLCAGSAYYLIAILLPDRLDARGSWEMEARRRVRGHLSTSGTIPPTGTHTARATRDHIPTIV
jgi:hypothetical protein